MVCNMLCCLDLLAVGCCFWCREWCHRRWSNYCWWYEFRCREWRGSILDNKDEQGKTVIHTVTHVVTGNFLKLPVGKKRGKYVKFLGFLLDFSRSILVWENSTIPIKGPWETQNIPSNGIFMTPVIPNSGISLYQIIPNAMILFSQFFPIVGISHSPLFHNNGILLSQIYPYDGILLSLNYPSAGILLPQIIPNSGDSLSLFFPNTGISKH